MNLVAERYAKFREEIEPEIEKRRKPEMLTQHYEHEYERLDDAYWQQVERARAKHFRRKRTPAFAALRRGESEKQK